MSTIFAQAPIACIHNPAAGAEAEMDEDAPGTAPQPKRVAVVGGGPAGLRAAWTLARRGHQVTLFERKTELGGQVRWWAKAESRRELVGIVDWLVARVAEEAIEIRLGHEITVDDLERGGFDDIVFATGLTALRHGWTMLRPERWDGPPLPGAELPHVLTYMELLGSGPPVGKRAVLFDTMGCRQAAVTAEYLAQNGVAVTFVTQLGQPSPDLASSRDWGKVHGMLRKAGVRFLVDRELTEITPTSVGVRDLYTGETEELAGIDQVVLVIGAAANDGLYNGFAHHDDAPACHLIGDAMAPRRVNDAIREGEIIARRI